MKPLLAHQENYEYDEQLVSDGTKNHKLFRLLAERHYLGCGSIRAHDKGLTKVDELFHYGIVENGKALIENLRKLPVFSEYELLESPGSFFYPRDGKIWAMLRAKKSISRKSFIEFGFELGAGGEVDSKPFKFKVGPDTLESVMLNGQGADAVRKARSNGEWGVVVYLDRYYSRKIVEVIVDGQEVLMGEKPHTKELEQTTTKFMEELASYLQGKE